MSGINSASCRPVSCLTARLVRAGTCAVPKPVNATSSISAICDAVNDATSDVLNPAIPAASRFIKTVELIVTQLLIGIFEK